MLEEGIKRKKKIYTHEVEGNTVNILEVKNGQKILYEKMK